ncbi:MAG: hypothetical protein J6M39_08225 [Lachnospiraceae bacterium]|nr:hypothetical protein [Lachnospiraceae bacterium]
MGVNSIKEKDFFRLSFILQDSSETTNNASLRKIIEEVLFNNRSEMEIDEIREVIFKNFELEFTNDEISSALNLSKNKHIIETEGKYILSANYISELAKGITVEEKLKGLIKEFKKNLNIEKEENELYMLLSRYIFHCFNSGKQDIFALVNGIKTYEDIEFSASEEEKHIINDFLNWDNDNKNKFIYNVISYSYVYCSLTTKKNSLLSKTIFSNKEFYLDANIIFRLAGLNKEDRQKTITSFKNKCEELNIKLFYTTDTYNEIMKSIDSRINWLNYINGEAIPPNLKVIPENKKDIYNIYCHWCSKRNNRPGDFLSFKKYITSIINDSLERIKHVDINKYNFEETESLSEEILLYKQQRNKETIKEYSDIDAKNILYIIDKRSKSDNKSLFSVQQYLISADQTLISFMDEKRTGVPIVVKPSTWLSIMLKFGGRTNDDIKSFILFLNLRYDNREINDIDITLLLHEMKVYTKSEKVKELIVEEIYNNKVQYQEFIDNEEYGKIIEISIDKVLEDNKRTLENNYNVRLSDLEKSKKEEIEKEKKVASELKTDENAYKLALRDFIIDKKKKIGICYIIIIVLSVFGVAILYTCITKIFTNLPIVDSLKIIINNESYLEVAGVIIAAIGITIAFICWKINYYNSDDYKKETIEKLKREYLKLLNN